MLRTLSRKSMTFLVSDPVPQPDPGGLGGEGCLGGLGPFQSGNLSLLPLRFAILSSNCVRVDTAMGAAFSR